MTSFGLDQPADVQGRVEPKALGSTLTVMAPQGVVDVALRVPGVHNARNALAAATAALAAGVSLAAVSQGLTFFSGVKGRLQVRPAAAGAILHRRHLQRQPGLGARRHRRAGGDAGTQDPGAGRHGRDRRPDRAVP